MAKLTDSGPMDPGGGPDGDGADLLHVVDLENPFGSENNTARFFDAGDRHRHHFLDLGRRSHPKFREALADSGSYHRWKRAAGIKVPKFLRRFLNRHRLGSLEPDALLFHRCFDGRARLHRCLYEDLSGRNLFWDHDTAWIKSQSEDGWCDPYEGFLAVSRASREMLRRKFSIPSDRIAVVPNTLRQPFLNRLESPGPTSSPGAVMNEGLDLLFVGRLAAEKGVNVLLRALEGLESSVQLTVVGDGPQREALEGMRKQLGLEDRVEFAGLQPDPVPYYRDSDVVVIPSLREPSGNVALEAGASATPIIASRVDGIPENLRDGEHGLIIEPTLPASRFREDLMEPDFPEFVFDPAADALAPPRWLDPDDLTEAIRWMADRPDQRRAMGREYRRFLYERFPPARARRELDRALDRLLGERAS